MNKDRLSSPPVIFLAYLALSFVVICAFRLIFPGGEEPLAYFRFKWRFTGGVINFIGLYPCLALSALVMPFGMKEHSGGGYAGDTFVGNKGFSPQFFRYISRSIITAAAAAALYGILFFVALPPVLNARESMEDLGALYKSAKAKVIASAAAKEWAEAYQFLEICRRIWPDDEEMETLKSEIAGDLSAYNYYTGEVPGSDAGDAVSEGGEEPRGGGLREDQPLDSAEAMRLAEAAFEEARYYDAHWLATLAARLARRGSAEIPPATALASRAWDKISSQEPTAQEKDRYSLFQMKRDGYEAMIAGDWISAFYTFQELSELTPHDPDVGNYLETSREGLEDVAFFIDELDLAMGRALRSAVFSLPGYSVQSPEGAPKGRLVLRFDSLTTLPDYSYAWSPELVAVDGNDAFLYRVSSNYGKIVPISMKDAEGRSVQRAALLLRALDRNDKAKRWDPVWTAAEDTAAENTAGGISPEKGNAQILLNCSYDDFLLLAKIKGGGLEIGDLLSAERTAGNYGYSPEIFRAEFLRRLGEPVFFLPMAVLALLLGWRYRARRKPRYVYVPMLGILPLVFNGMVIGSRTILNNLSIWLSLSFDFRIAVIYFSLAAGLCFILALALLAAQHG